MLIIDGEWVTSDYGSRIQEAVMHPTHLKWWLQKYKHLDSLAYDSIDWKAIGNTRKYISGTDEARLIKYLNGWLNTGR